MAPLRERDAVLELDAVKDHVPDFLLWTVGLGPEAPPRRELPPSPGVAAPQDQTRPGRARGRPSLSGKVQLDDAYLGGEHSTRATSLRSREQAAVRGRRVAGRNGRAAVRQASTPQSLHFGIDSRPRAGAALAPGCPVTSDGLACFGTVIDAGLPTHANRGGRAAASRVAAVQVVEHDVGQSEHELP